MKYFCLLPNAGDPVKKPECGTLGLINHPVNLHPCGMLVIVGAKSPPHQRAHRWEQPGKRHQKGIGVHCFYYNPVDDTYCLLKHAVIDMNEFFNPTWPCVIDLLRLAMQTPGLWYTSVVIDKSCATAEVLAFMAALKTNFWCEVADTWSVIDSDASQMIRQMHTVDFTATELINGKILWSGRLRQDHTVCAFKVENTMCAQSYFLSSQLSNHTVNDVSLINELIKAAQRQIRVKTRHLSDRR